jgi:DNA-binding NtrC family response regulator
MRTLFSELERIQNSRAAVVIEGESGTGKELAARAIHTRSVCKTGPLVTVNCGAIPEGLVESELFGHRKGAFTSAHADRIGLIEEADGGTLFLDEIGELKLDAQAKLLRVLESGELRRVGDSQSRPVDLRVIAATNRNLTTMVEDGAFREDLFYRLAIFQLRLPPLRERPADIPLLVEHLLNDLSPRATASLSAAALETLVSAPWPGNVRQLRNVLERASTLAQGGVIEASHVGPLDPTSDGLGFGAELFGLPFKEAKLRFGALYAERITEEAGGSIPAAAKRAGVSRQTFYRLLGPRP